jgi:hypothetical protein
MASHGFGYALFGSKIEGQPGAVIALVARSPRLETLRIALYGFPSGGVRPAPLVQLALLQDLQLEATLEEQIVCFVRSISIPTRSLYIHAALPARSTEEYMRAIGPYMLDF